jgi:membrane fusion protein, copper/silver efflux system
MKISVFFILPAILFFSGCGSNIPEKDRVTDEKTKQVAYTCVIHPEIVMDEPGQCPICGMTLVVKNDFEIDSTQVEMPADTLNPLNI